MCGISGYYSFNYAQRWKDFLPQMNLSLSHRGPDAEGIFSNEYCGLAHRRLSIIDLSAEANQPMKSADGRYKIIFNGEVYNFKELAEKHLRDVSLKTKSDTEVLLELFAKIGTKMFEQLNGMFAGALVDLHAQTLYLFRDSQGKKPLFYFKEGSDIAFASEIKALKKIKDIPFSLNREAIPYFLHTNFIPEPITIYKNIFKLKAGHFLKIEPQHITEIEFEKKATFNTSKKSNKSISEVKSEVKHLLEKSILYRLESDVSFGTLLSGGVDSSLVTAIANQLSSTKLKTFTIGFQDGWLDESKYARKISAYFGTEHHEHTLDVNDSISLIEKIFTVYDEPFGDTSSLPVMLVSQLVREKAKMVLTGDGGDELFMGYGTNIWANRLDNNWLKLCKPILSHLQILGENNLTKLAKMSQYNSSTNLQAHIFSQEQGIFSEKEVVNILNSTQINFSLIELEKEQKLSPAQKQSLWDMTFYLREDLLVKIDRASMKYSLEMRSPFLDKNLIEYAFNLPENYKLNNGVGKFILKELLKDYLPLEYFNRPKQGFAVPLAKWLRRELRNLVDIYAGENITRELQIFDPQQIKEIKNEFLNGNDLLFHKVWLIVSLQKWIKTNLS